ncbi:MAG: hypothetical protein U0232_05530 [Thermomicrobiales bacterium]
MAIPADGARLLGIDPATLLVNRTLAASSNDDWARREWLRDAYLASGPLTYVDFPNLMRAKLTAVALQERQAECWGYPEPMLAPVGARLHQEVFRETGAPLGGTILASIPADDAWTSPPGLSPRPRTHLHARRRGLPPPRRPPDRARTARLARAGACPRRAPGDRPRHLRHHRPGDWRQGPVQHPGGRDLGRSPARRRARRPRPASTPIWSVLAQQRAGGGPATLLVPTPVGQVRVEASASTTDDAVAVVLTLERPPAAPTAPDSWPLTPAERQTRATPARRQQRRHRRPAPRQREHRPVPPAAHLREDRRRQSQPTPRPLLPRHLRPCPGVVSPARGSSR